MERKILEKIKEIFFIGLVSFPLYLNCVIHKGKTPESKLEEQVIKKIEREQRSYGRFEEISPGRYKGNFNSGEYPWLIARYFVDTFAKSKRIDLTKYKTPQEYNNLLSRIVEVMDIPTRDKNKVKPGMEFWINAWMLDEFQFQKRENF